MAFDYVATVIIHITTAFIYIVVEGTGVKSKEKCVFKRIYVKLN